MVEIVKEEKLNKREEKKKRLFAFLKKLPPEKRIAFLKKLEEERKKEIELAEEMIKSTEEELKALEEFRDVIPQLRAVDIEELFTPEEKEIFKVARFVSGRRVHEEETEERERPERSGTIEEVVAGTEAREEKRREEEFWQQVYALSRQPAEELYNRARELYTAAAAGRITPEQREEAIAIQYATREKLEAIAEGSYQPEERESVLNATTRIERVTEKIKEIYRGKLK